MEHNNVLIKVIKKENKTLQREITHLQSVKTTLSTENAKLKETLLDLQSRRMQDNLLLMVTEEREEETHETSETNMKNFMKAQLKIPLEEVNSICLEQVHGLGPRNSGKAAKAHPNHEHAQRET